jgi:autotransporter-associated beta strand protein
LSAPIGLGSTTYAVNATNVPASSGTLNVLGGVININQLGSSVPGRLLIGLAGTGAINVSAGQLNFIGTNGSPIVLGGDTELGQAYAHTGATGILTVSGTGAVTIANGNGGLQLGANNSGSLTNNVAGVTGIVNLYGGTLITGPGIQFVGGTSGGGSAAGYINFNGGTLKAGTNNARFLQGLTLATVSTNGAIIDDGGHSITIGQSLLTDTNLSGVDGGLTKLGSGTLILTNASTYTGATTVSNGTLEVDGSLSVSPVTVINGGTLSGNGALGAAVTVNAGGLLAPGTKAAPSTLTINSNLTLAGSLAIAINTSLAQSNSMVIVSGILTNSGTGVVTVTNAGPDLVVGDSFKLFNQPVLNGAALTIASSGGVTWTNNLAVDGSIQVLTVTPAINPLPGMIQFSMSGGTLALAWPTNLGWILQTQTNTLSVGLNTNWVVVPGSTSVTNTSITINPTNGAVFYRMVHP